MDSYYFEVIGQIDDIKYSLRYLVDSAIEINRPFNQLKPRVFIDGDMWCALYGKNIAEGVAGFGKTPHQASIAFDEQWMNSTVKYTGEKE